MVLIRFFVKEGLETIKMILVAFFIFGLRIERGKRNYFLLLYWPFVLLFANIITINELYIHILWEIFLFIFLFQGSFKRNFQQFCFAYLLISFVDMTVWAIFIYITGIHSASTVKDNKLNALSILFWILLAFLCKNKREKLKSFWEQVKGIYYCLILFMFIGLAIIFAYMQIIITEFLEPSQGMKQFVAFVMGIVIFLILILCILLLILKQKNEDMIRNNQMQKELFYYQKKYYEENLKKQEDLASFRHEFCHHVKGMLAMLEKGYYSNLNEYLMQLTNTYQEMNIAHTGYYLADYILSEIKEELSEQVEVTIIGRFPEQMNIKESDFCVLFFNVLENAKEAVEKVEGKRKILLEIRNYQKNLYLVVKNSIRQEAEMEISLKTEKRDKKIHGYGIRNIKQVVINYQGEIEWKQEYGFFIVEIILPILNYNF